MACNFKSCKETYLLSNVIGKLRMVSFIHGVFPPIKYEENFFKKKHSMRVTFLDKFMGGKFTGC